ncbi:MAG: glycerol kinase GlpK [Clostridiales Family XIII bacterium]|nr:glycerol kinase GlpK [Clostridiales Family XIII bacterium]
MSDKYIMAMDQGTSSCRCILFDKNGASVSVAQEEFPQIFPRPGWVEHDPMAIWRAQMAVAREAMLKAGAGFRDIAAIGVANQRETAVVWDRLTGEPVHNAIVWQCRRTSDVTDALIKAGKQEFFRERTGLIPDAYFSATKIKWILDNVEGAAEKAGRGELAFGTIDAWLIWKMTGGKAHVTDYSNASRTMLFNIHTLDWDEGLLGEFGVPRSMLPQVLPSSHVYGMTSPELFGGGIPIGGAAGDQQAALFGHACFDKGEAKNTYGTGCFLLMNTGEVPVRSESGLLTTVAWGLGGEVRYALEGSVFVAGAVVQWLRDELRLIGSASESERLAESVEDTAGVYFVPAFVGLGAPYWDSKARGTMLGLTRGAGRAHIVRAALESIAFQTTDLIRAMERDSGVKLGSLKADGGASANNFLMAFQANVMGATVRRPACQETTALGAAYLAGLAVGYWESQDAISRNWAPDRDFHPSLERAKAEEMVAGWHRAVAMARATA